MRSCLVTEPIIPEVVPGLGEEGPVVLPQHQAVLIVPVIGLAISPVKPLNSLVHVRPVPLSLVVVRVVTSSRLSSQPKLVPLSWLSHLEQLSLEPVVNPRVVQLSYPGIVELAENISIVPGHSLPTTEHEAPASTPVLLQKPPIRTVISILVTASPPLNMKHLHPLLSSSRSHPSGQ